MKKHILATLLSVSLSLALVACGKPASDSSVSEPEVIEEIVEATPEPIEEIVEETSEVIDETETVLEVEETSSIPADGIYKIDQVIYEEEGIQVVCDSYDANKGEFNMVVHSSIDYRDTFALNLWLLTYNGIAEVDGVANELISGTQDKEFTIHRYHRGEEILGADHDIFMDAVFHIMAFYETDGNGSNGELKVNERVEIKSDNYDSDLLSSYFGDKVASLEFASSYTIDSNREEFSKLHFSATSNIDFFCKENDEGNVVVTIDPKDVVFESTTYEYDPDAKFARLDYGIIIDDEKEILASQYFNLVYDNNNHVSVCLVDLNKFRERNNIPKDQKLKISIKIQKLLWDETKDEPYKVDLGEY